MPLRHFHGKCARSVEGDDVVMRWLLFLLFIPLTAKAQVEIHLSSKRQNFLLCEPIVLDIDVRNASRQNVVLENGANHSAPWLSFLISRADGNLVAPDISFAPPLKTLVEGETFHLPVNITPLYRIRDTGQYRIQAVVRLNEKNSIVTEPLVINVGVGNVIWKQTQKIGDGDRLFSLVCFAEKEITRIYLRIEEPQNNVTYGAVPLGDFNNSLNMVTPLFDARNHIHVLHPNTARTYIYTILDPVGKILDRQECDSSSRLKQNEQGEVSLIKSTIP